MTQSSEQKSNGVKHVVIVGGGFAGLHCARRLAANPNVRVTLLDKDNYQQFQPLLYQVATALLAPSNIAFNLRAALEGNPKRGRKIDRGRFGRPQLAYGANRPRGASSRRLPGASGRFAGKLFRYARSRAEQLSPVVSP